MNARTAVTVLALLAALTLTGCAGAVAATPSEPDDAATTSVGKTAAPLVAETPADEGDANEPAFLERFRELQAGFETIIPNATDYEIIESGYIACERLAAGEPSVDISLIEGEERNANSGMYLDSVSIVQAAKVHLCG